MVVVSGLLLSWHYSTLHTVLPYEDGSHHVSGVANLANSVRSTGLQALASYAREDTYDFLSYATFTLPTLIVGNGRPAFAFVWVGCLAAVLGAVWYFFRRQDLGLPRALCITGFLALGLFQSRLGGAADARVDLLAVSIAFLCLVAIAERRILAALLLLLLSSFAKEAAISLLVPLFVAGFVFGYLPLKRPQAPSAWQLGQLLLIAIGGVVFVTRLLPQAAPYYLMATGGTSTTDRLTIFATSAVGQLAASWRFYPRDLAAHYGGWILLAVPICLILVLRRWPASDIRLGLFALACLAYTYVLLTISPLHSVVLTVWFLPAVGLAMLFLARAGAAVPGIWVPLGATLALMAVAVIRTPFQAEQAQGAASTPVRMIFSQAEELGDYADQQFTGSNKRVILLTNFLWIDGPVVDNYDVYRALIHERVRHARPLIYGWELGDSGGAWGKELPLVKQYAETLLLLQEHPEVMNTDYVPQRVGRAVWEAVQQFRSAHPNCLTEVAQPIQLPRVGTQQALRLTPDTACIEPLISEMSQR